MQIFKKIALRRKILKKIIKEKKKIFQFNNLKNRNNYIILIQKNFKNIKGNKLNYKFF